MDKPQTKEILKKILTESFKNKTKLDNLNKEVKKLNQYKKMAEENIINIMEELGLDAITAKNKFTKEEVTINLDIKTKKKGLTKKVIKQNCLLLCNGDKEKAEDIYNFLYDKSSRSTTTVEKINYKLLKK